MLFNKSTHTKTGIKLSDTATLLFIVDMIPELRISVGSNAISF